MQIDLIRAQNYAAEIAREAGRMHRKYFGSSKLAVRQKGIIDISTNADDESGELLVRRIREKYPGAEILMEETSPKDYSGFRDAEYLWVIDPLDGTVNFSRGNANFAVSIALVCKSKPIVGVAYLPFSDEMYVTNEETGRSYHNGRAMRVSSVDKRENRRIHPVRRKAMGFRGICAAGKKRRRKSNDAARP